MCFKCKTMLNCPLSLSDGRSSLCCVWEFCCQMVESVCWWSLWGYLAFLLLGKYLSPWLWNAPLHWESSDFLSSSFGWLTSRQLNPLGNSDFNLWSSLLCKIRGQSCKGIWMVDENFSAFYSEQVTSPERPDFLAFCSQSSLTASCSRIPS